VDSAGPHRDGPRAFVVYSTWAAFQNKNYFVGANMVETSLVPSTHPASAVRAYRSEVCLRLERLDDIAGLLILIFPWAFA